MVPQFSVDREWLNLISGPSTVRWGHITAHHWRDINVQAEEVESVCAFSTCLPPLLAGWHLHHLKPRIWDGRSTAWAGLDSWVIWPQISTLDYMIPKSLSCEAPVIWRLPFIAVRYTLNNAQIKVMRPQSASHEAGGTVEFGLWCMEGREEDWEIREFLFESRPAVWL